MLYNVLGYASIIQQSVLFGFFGARNIWNIWNIWGEKKTGLGKTGINGFKISRKELKKLELAWRNVGDSSPVDALWIALL